MKGDDEPPRKKEKQEKIKRSPNAWILFRKSRHAGVVAQNKGIHNSEVSKIVSVMWKAMSEAEKKPYFDWAAALKQEHKRKYPHYKYQPSAEKAKQNRATKAGQAAQVREEEEDNDSDSELNFFDMDSYQAEAHQDVTQQDVNSQGAGSQFPPNQDYAFLNGDHMDSANPAIADQQGVDRSEVFEPERS
ncbi:high mobility group box domain-containing protein [Xylariaceae sp. FL1651]|nr:high mobility group box domain-containing protein [Xylariaceae sp. FL1651]